jgi:hypothetical protein
MTRLVSLLIVAGLLYSCGAKDNSGSSSQMPADVAAGEGDKISSREIIIDTLNADELAIDIVDAGPEIQDSEKMDHGPMTDGAADLDVFFAEILPDLPSGPVCGQENYCEKGVCNPESLLCVACLTDQDCQDELFCLNSECEPDVCDQGSQICVNEKTALMCNANGSEKEFLTCPPGDICAWGNCAEPICEPYGKWCTEDHFIAVCDGSGTAVNKVLCPPGFACFADECSPIYHNIYVIFDTSGSMYSSTSCNSNNMPNCQYPWPECEKKGHEFSLLGFCKAAFYAVFYTLQQQGHNASFALFRFPQSWKSEPDCTMGHYDSKDYITGDDSSHVTPDTPESWFNTNMHEVLCVPFPKEMSDKNLEKCLEWVDFNEEVTPIAEQACSSDSQCPSGFCDSSEGNSVCHYHSNPELRANGWTPLGRTMFYAGEYVRKFAVVDGKPCSTDEDCLNINYRCSGDGKCFDPLRYCRENLLLLFTDGGESEFSSPNNFFNPSVQAKRFHYGLGCLTDEDCLSGSTCNGGYKICWPEDQIDVAPYQDIAAGADLLLDFNGDPIRMSVHVVYAGNDPEVNKAIADNGGGGYYPVEGNDMSQLVDTILSIVDIKNNLEACVPNMPE